MFRKKSVSLHLNNLTTFTTMNFRPILCHPSLQPFIRNYWLLTAQCVAAGTQRIFSNGATSLHFYLNNNVRLENEERQYATALNRHDLSLMEMHTEVGDFHILGVEFVPFCARLFFSPEPNATGNHLTPEDLKDAAFAQLSDAIHATTDTEQQVRLLDDFFIKRLGEIPHDDVNLERLSTVFDDIVPVNGEPSVVKDFETISTADLANTACLSQKQFTRVFEGHVGLRPKAYLRLLRFNKAMQELRHSDAQNLTEIAWRCGYCDLPHMTNDFRQLCGYSPSEILELGAQLTEAFEADFSGKMKKKVLLQNVV